MSKYKAYIEDHQTLLLRYWWVVEKKYSTTSSQIGCGWTMTQLLARRAIEKTIKKDKFKFKDKTIYEETIEL